MAGLIPAICASTAGGWMAGTTFYRMHRSWNRSVAAIATSSWPGLSGPSVAARAGIGGPGKPGHDDGETLAAIEQVFDFMAVSEMCASRRACPGHDGEEDDLAPPDGCGPVRPDAQPKANT